MQDSKRESKRYKKYKPLKKDKDGKPVESKSTDEELESSGRYENPDRDYPHPTLGIKHKYIDMMRKYGGMDDPRRVKKEEEKKELLLQTGSWEYPAPEERGPVPEISHPRSEYDGIVDNDYHKVQQYMDWPDQHHNYDLVHGNDYGHLDKELRKGEFHMKDAEE